MHLLYVGFSWLFDSMVFTMMIIIWWYLIDPYVLVFFSALVQPVKGWKVWPESAPGQLFLLPLLSFAGHGDQVRSADSEDILSFGAGDDRCCHGGASLLNSCWRMRCATLEAARRKQPNIFRKAVFLVVLLDDRLTEEGQGGNPAALAQEWIQRAVLDVVKCNSVIMRGLHYRQINQDRVSCFSLMYYNNDNYNHHPQAINSKWLIIFSY